MQTEKRKRKKRERPVHIKHVQKDQSNLWQEICSKGAGDTSICLSEEMQAQDLGVNI